MIIGSVLLEIDELVDQLERMGANEFIEQFEKVMGIHKNYNYILDDFIP